MKEKKLKYLSVGQLADYCGVNSQIIMSWVKSGKIKVVKNSKKEGYKISVENLKKITIEKKRTLFLHAKLHPENQSKVLIVDDEKSIIESIEPIFVENGFQVISSTSACEAMFLLHNERPLILTLDLGLLDSNGIEVLKTINALGLNKDIWVIIISAASESELHSAVNFGADFYLQKPFDENDLNKIVNKLSVNLKKKAA